MANINFLENEVIEFKKTTGELKEFIERCRKAKRINFPYTNKEEILKKIVFSK